jgi:hypothetical protein
VEGLVLFEIRNEIKKKTFLWLWLGSKQKMGNFIFKKSYLDFKFKNRFLISKIQLKYDGIYAIISLENKKKSLEYTKDVQN